MGDVVAVIGHQDGLLARQNDDIADRVFLDFELVHLQRVVDKLAGRRRRRGRVRRVRHVAQQGEVALQLFGKLLAGQGTLTRCQQRRTAQVHSVGRTGIVNAYHQV